MFRESCLLLALLGVPQFAAFSAATEADVATLDAIPSATEVEAGNQLLEREPAPAIRPGRERGTARNRSARPRETRRENSRNNRERKGARQRVPPPSEELEEEMEFIAESGFAFIDGQYVAAPYRIEIRDGVLHLNEFALSELFAAPEGNRSARLGEDAVEGLYSQLDGDLVLVKLPGSPVFTPEDRLSDQLLALLSLDPASRSEGIAEFLRHLPANQNPEQWSEWLAQTELSAELRERIGTRADFLRQTQERTRRYLHAEALMENYSYPLTLFGMIVVVLAVGYLLAFNPSMAQFLPEPIREAQLAKSVRYAVILIVVMSGLDLAWTMLSSSVGLMNELNPVGSNLINDPVALIQFKALATSLAAGLFLALRNFRSAQLASWWMCIVCTLVSARWLVFNSLYLG
jgi:hypothetical protein